MGLPNHSIQVTINPTPLRYKNIANNKYQITKSVECLIQKWKREKYKYTIHAAYETDFRSGPRWLEDLGIPKIGNTKIAASWLLHDINYSGYVTRKEADNLLYCMLLAGGLGNINAQLVFHGVRIFGGFNYYHKASNKVELEVIHPGIDLELFDPNEPILESMEQLPGETPDGKITFDEQYFEPVKQELEVLAAKQNKKIDTSEVREYYEPTYFE